MGQLINKILSNVRENRLIRASDTKIVLKEPKTNQSLHISLPDNYDSIGIRIEDHKTSCNVYFPSWAKKGCDGVIVLEKKDQTKIILLVCELKTGDIKSAQTQIKSSSAIAQYILNLIDTDISGNNTFPKINFEIYGLINSRQPTTQPNGQFTIKNSFIYLRGPNRFHASKIAT